MNEKFARAMAGARTNKSVHELAIIAQNTKTGEEASGFSGKLNGQNIGPDTPYFLASATKLFVTALIMQQVEKGQLELTAPATTFFAPGRLDGLHVLNGVDHTSKITVENLLAHTSGLPDYFEQKQPDGSVFAHDILQDKDRSFTVEDVIDMVQGGMKPAFAPSTPGRAFYSDTNYQLLTAIIEKVLGTSFADSVTKNIAIPLGLKNTWVFDIEGPQRQRKIIPLRNGDIQLDIPLVMTGVAGDGGVVSTAADGLVFIRAFFGGGLFSKQLLSQITAQWRRIFFPLQYGTGVMLFRLPRFLSLFQKQPDLIGHSGISGAFLFAEPETGVFISGTVNQLSSRSLPYKIMLPLVAALRE